MKTRNIIELTIAETGDRKYFTSIPATVAYLNSIDIQIATQTIRNYCSINKTNVFENEKIRIEKDIPLHLETKNRSVPPENIFRKDELKR